tara:strand:+ start:1212 stop:2318 length:1107 start_codon:yes stop_codon:yes gene_type:complete
MKIIIVCYPTFGGSGVLATELGHQLATNGHSVHFIAYEKPVRLKENDKSIFFHKVNVPFYPLFNFQPYELALSTKIVDVATKNSIDLIHVHYAIPHAYAAYMAQKMLKMNNIKLPIITTLHGTDITLVGKHPFYKSAVKFSIEKSNRVTSVSESLKNDTHEFFKTNKKINVVPNFVDIKKFDNQLDLCSNKDDIKTITHVSNFRPVKNIRTLIKIFSKISQKHDCRFNLIGEGPELELAKSMSEELKIKNIYFLGNTDEVEKELCHSDIFILPSKAESFGLAALEAMASKNAIVSSNVGGLPELNLNNKTGFTCDYSDIDQFVSSIETLLTENDLLEKFKINAYNKAKKFDIIDIVPLYENEYKKLLK